MKIRIAGILFFVLLLSANAFCQQEFFPFLGKINASDVNVRAGQNINFEKLIQLDEGDDVIVVDKSYDWYKIKLPVRVPVYVVKKYVKRIDDNAGEITASRVNVRARDSIDSTILDQINLGDKVYIVKEIGDWYQIEPLDMTYGWVSDKFINYKSSDISLYNPKKQSLRQLVEQKQKEQEKKEIVIEKPKVIAAAGILKEQKDESINQANYIITVDGKPTYYLEGMKHLLDNFINYRMSIEGEKKKVPGLSLPVIVLTKAKLIL